MAMAVTVEAARTCIDCGQTKPAYEFYLYGKTRDKRCKKCRGKLNMANRESRAGRSSVALEPETVAVPVMPEVVAQTLVCNTCHHEKPISEFYTYKTKEGRRPLKKCKKCQNDERIVNLRAANPQTRPEKKEVECSPHHYLCGEAAVLEVFPDFYEDHIRPVKGQEWQVCKHCGRAKLVDVYGGQKVMLVEPPQLRMLVSERASSLPAGERAFPKHPALGPRPDMGDEPVRQAPEPLHHDLLEVMEGLPPDYHVSVETPSGFVARIDPALVGTTEGEQLVDDLDMVGEALLEDYGSIQADDDGAPTTPLLPTEAMPYGEDQAIKDLHLRLAEQEELIQELRGQLVNLDGRARRVIEEDQALWKARIAAKDRAIATLVARLHKADRLIAYAWGTTRGIESSARQTADLLEGYEH